jgi:hypothetical protein
VPMTKWSHDTPNSVSNYYGSVTYGIWSGPFNINALAYQHGVLESQGQINHIYHAIIL